MKGKLRMAVKKNENISSDETLGQEIKKKIQQRLGIPYRHKQLRIEFEKRERGVFVLYITRKVKLILLEKRALYNF